MARDKSPRDGTIDARGLRLHYLDWGNEAAPPMLLLHGFTGHAHTWDTFARAGGPASRTPITRSSSSTGSDWSTSTWS